MGSIVQKSDLQNIQNKLIAQQFYMYNWLILTKIAFLTIWNLNHFNI